MLIFSLLLCYLSCVLTMPPQLRPRRGVFAAWSQDSYTTFRRGRAFELPGTHVIDLSATHKAMYQLIGTCEALPDGEEGVWVPAASVVTLPSEPKKVRCNFCAVALNNLAHYSIHVRRGCERFDRNNGDQVSIFNRNVETFKFMFGCNLSPLPLPGQQQEEQEAAVLLQYDLLRGGMPPPDNDALRQFEDRIEREATAMLASLRKAIIAARSGDEQARMPNSYAFAAGCARIATNVNRMSRRIARGNAPTPPPFPPFPLFPLFPPPGDDDGDDDGGPPPGDGDDNGGPPPGDGDDGGPPPGDGDDDGGAPPGDGDDDGGPPPGDGGRGPPPTTTPTTTTPTTTTPTTTTPTTTTPTTSSGSFLRRRGTATTSKSKRRREEEEVEEEEEVRAPSPPKRPRRRKRDDEDEDPPPVPPVARRSRRLAGLGVAF
ncbi:WAS/WASL-interacting protein family member 1-like [Thrips palmi]|uniref:WAS/WASL-interacting protein family member 1-like n=1 Tax=Thrips palmi TaxID=161013 RepID=A0A6P8ZY95_THRPL|nr:WAS/WASL-interacting protein family member 1-like [Thrips palmi]XP_034250379.1 WAS/WASL-interacting protein family member 1-like [Thrips palmi]